MATEMHTPGGPLNADYHGHTLPPDYLPVPVEVAKQICHQFHKASVLIASHDRRAGVMHYTTFGVGPMDKVSIAGCADWLSRALGGGADPLKRWEDFRSLSIAELKAEVDKLRRFKEYVHARLDAAGVPADPESPHKAEGCRIGGRLDLVLADRTQRDELRDVCREMVTAFGGSHAQVMATASKMKGILDRMPGEQEVKEVPGG